MSNYFTLQFLSNKNNIKQTNIYIYLYTVCVCEKENCKVQRPTISLFLLSLLWRGRWPVNSCRHFSTERAVVKCKQDSTISKCWFYQLVFCCSSHIFCPVTLIHIFVMGSKVVSRAEEFSTLLRWVLCKHFNLYSFTI